MIGQPSNFQHTGHIGSGDLSISTKDDYFNAMESQMQSKGGYDRAIPVHVH